MNISRGHSVYREWSRNFYATVLTFCLIFACTATAEDIIIDSNASLPAGTYDYNNVLLTNNAVLTFNGSITLNADSLTIDSGASISAKGTGFAAGQGPGAGGFYSGHGTGAGFGGKGGSRNNSGGAAYGSSLHPAGLGSGGANGNAGANKGGAGGGAIILNVGSLTVNGAINTDGAEGILGSSGLYGGGGAGGSINITADQFTGAGSISANGGYGRYGAGAGGRVAVYYQSSSFTGTAQTKGGTGITVDDYGQDGTVALVDLSNNTLYAGPSFRLEQVDSPIVFDRVILIASKTSVGGSVSLTADELSLDANSIFTISGDSTLLTVANLYDDANSAIILTGNSVLAVTSAVNISNSSIATAGPQNLRLPSQDIALAQGAILKWGPGSYSYDNVSLTGNSSLVFNGAVALQAQSVTIDPCCSISATGAGYPGEQGPGIGGLYSGHGTGAGYGGRGGSRNDSGGIIYGSELFPSDLGSGGGNSNASINISGAGGGAVRLDVDSLTVNGFITADGTDGIFASGVNLYGGGGSGGSVLINAKTIAGSGVIRTNGGYGRYGAGGGGRLAVYYENSSFTGLTQAKGGTGITTADYGQDGTVIISGPSEDSPSSSMQASADFETHSAISETLRLLTASLTNVTISGDFNSVIDFNSFQVITIESGPFAGQGFAKANWQVNLGGVNYSGTWRAVATRVSSQDSNSINITGVLSGDISGITKGAFVESSADPNAALVFSSEWNISRLKNITVTSTVQLSGALSAVSQTVWPATSLYVCQGSFNADCFGSYTGPLGVVLTHLRIASAGNPCYGEGFSALSYESDVGQGMAYAYNNLQSPGVSILTGASANPLLGVLVATLDENHSPKRLSVTFERVDLGLPPQPILDVKVIAPSRVSPGQTISYVLEYSNEGARPADNVRIASKLPKKVQLVSSSPDAVFDSAGLGDGLPEISWFIESVPAKSKGRRSVTVKVNWGLSQLETLNSCAIVESYQEDQRPDFSVQTTVAEPNDAQIDVSRVFYLDGNEVWASNSTCIVHEAEFEINEPNLIIDSSDTTFSSLLEFTANPYFYIKTDGDVSGGIINLELLVQLYIMSEPEKSGTIIKVGAWLGEKSFLTWLHDNDYIGQSSFDQYMKTAGETYVVMWEGRDIIGKFSEQGDYYDFITKGVMDKLDTSFAGGLGETIAEYESQKTQPRIRTDSAENALADALELHLRKYEGMKPPEPYTVPREQTDDLYWAWLKVKKAAAYLKQSIAAALDPNKKYGPQGRVLPDQKLDYRVEFENVGSGIAFGVYFTDTLDEDVNDATLQIGPVYDVNTGAVLAGPGIYNPATRTIYWFVGQVDPNQGGFADFSVNVNPDAGHGTEIINYATIYFPSVPQQLQTNGIVSTVLLNLPPVANAGPDQSAHIGETVVLDGSLSTDPDADLLSFEWAFGSKPTGSSAVLMDPNSLNPYFVPDVRGTYTVTLLVSDGNETSSYDVVKISTINVAPVANAGADQTVRPGDTVTLDASASTDSDGDLLTYSWSFESVPQGSLAALSNPDSVNPTFVADIPGDYIVRLVVNDSIVDSVPDTVVISTINLAPVANAGEDQSVHVGDLVTLDASASSDPDGDSLTYQWVFTVVPQGSAADLNDADFVHPTFTADLPGTYVLSLTVNDGLQDSAPDTVTISTINVAPIAAAGDDQSVYIGEAVDLNGLSSWDPDGDLLTYNWSFTTLPAGSLAILNNADTATPGFLADVPGTYIVALIVSDGWLDSAADTVTISTINTAPTADAGDDQSVVAGSQVTLDASQSSDPDGDTLTYKWAFTSKPCGSTAALSNPTSANPAFTADKPGIYVLTLVVNDGFADSASDSVTVSVVSQQTYAIELTQQIIQSINAMDRHDFRNRLNKRVLTNKLNAVIEKIERERFRDAIRQLENDILRKTDGCAEIGHPDFSDWIIRCDAQSQIYQPILDVIDVLETLPRACGPGCFYGIHKPGCRAH
jgi:uncharacterized repeat protein (TIGR01451 family)